MNPFAVNKIIKESKKNEERISIDMLSVRCGSRVRHKYIKMSDEMFECSDSGGFPRHWVERLKLHSWITLWFERKEDVFTPKNDPISVDRPELEVPEDKKPADVDLTSGLYE